MDLKEQESKPSGKSKLIPTAEKCSQGTFLMPSDSMTCEQSESTICRPSISSAEDSPARTSAMPESEQELTESAADCGASMRESFAKFDRATSSWKTSQLCLDGEWSEFSETWPRAGMTQNGIAFRRLPLVPHISANGFGYLPTPVKSLGEMKGGLTLFADSMSCYRKEHENSVRPSGAKIGSSLRWCPEYVREALRTGGLLNPEWLEVLMGYPENWSMLETDASATPSSRRSPSGSEGE